MMTYPADTQEEAMQRYWQRLLDETLADAAAEGLDHKTVIEAMMHVAVSEYARHNGAAATARELYLVACKFRQTADAEERRQQQQSAPSSATIN